MTRYARSTGSKASNERTPNEATPWHILKQQLNEKLSKLGHTKKPKSAKELLQDKDLFYFDVGNVNNDWAKFEEKTVKSKYPVTKKSNKLKETSLDKAVNSNENKKDGDKGNFQKKLSKKRNIDEINTSTIDVKIKKRKKDLLPKLNNNVEEEDFADKNNIKQNKIIEKRSKLNKKKKQNKQNDHKFLETSQTNNTEGNISNAESNSSVTEGKKGMLFKHSMKQQRKANVHPRNNNRKMNKNNENSYKFGGQKTDWKKFENNKKNNRKPPKIRDDKEHKRRKEAIGSTKLTINGIEIELAQYDGFPVKKEDADRLRELKQKMIMKGIPRDEVNIAIKLERRRAEKALARIRKCVCFHCRKGGHNLSDCPELGSEQASTGICYKCGSTEHTYFECKVAKRTEFRYATCFICREQGHISKQCPDNPKGIYPQGGSCNLCGDVTHLKKDCPDLIKEKEETTITLNTIADDNIENLEGSTKRVQTVENKKPKKVVKF
nr:zinc finger CCHC domain-containing protein 9-like [Megalopta genalis]